LCRIRSHIGLGQLKGNTLARQIKEVGRNSGSDVVEIIMRAPKKERLSSRIINELANILGFADSRTQLEKLEIKGPDPGTNKLIPIDLLKDKLILDEKMVPESPRKRTLKCSDVYQVVEKGYVNLEPQLIAALSRLK
jgi:hypothetical protein